MVSAVTYGLFGLIVGSFLNVLVMRRGAAALSGRSMCISCGSVIRWYDNIPLLSWLMLRGRCRRCAGRISAQYPLVEGVTGALFAFIGSASLQPHLAFLACAIAAALVAIAAYDMLHTIIPDSWVYAFCALAILYAILSSSSAWSASLLPYLAGPVAALPLFVLWLFSRGAWMGLGDVKLALGIGWLLGALPGVTAIFFAFVIGACVTVCVLMPAQRVRAALARRGIARFRGTSSRLTMKSEVPFGPFLIIACFVVWFAQLYTIAVPLLPV